MILNSCSLSSWWKIGPIWQTSLVLKLSQVALILGDHLSQPALRSPASQLSLGREFCHVYSSSQVFSREMSSRRRSHPPKLFLAHSNNSWVQWLRASAVRGTLGTFWCPSWLAEVNEESVWNGDVCVSVCQ